MENNYDYLAGVKTDKGVVVHLEGWPFLKSSSLSEDGKPLEPILKVRNNVGQNNSTVVDMTISFKPYSKTLTYFFGKEYAPEKDNYATMVKVIAWDRVAEQLMNYNPSLRQKIGFTGIVKPVTYDKANGDKGHSLEMTLIGFKVVTKKQSEFVFDNSATFDSGNSNYGDDCDITPVDDGDMPF